MWILSLHPEDYRNKRGTILVNAFWILIILLLVVLAFAWRVSLELKISKIFTSRIKASYAAKAGLQFAVEIKKSKDKTPYDSLDDIWTNNDIFKDKEIGEAMVSIKYLHHYNENGEPVYFYGLIDEDRKINLNMGKEYLEILKRILENLASTLKDKEGIDYLTSDIINAIIDWRDEDTTTIDNNIENEYYGYINRNNKFKVLEELLLLKGMDMEKFRKLENYLTIYGSGRININTADEKVLRAVFSLLPIDYGYYVNEIISRRNINPFSSIDDLIDFIRQLLGLPEGELPEDIRNLINTYFTVSSTAFQANIEVKIDNKVKKTVKAIFTVPECKIIYWNEN